MSHDAERRRIEQFERIFRERGLPITTQRRVVLMEILARTDHPTADQIYDALKGRLHGLSRTTVYRILDTLVRFGMITRICHHGSAARFDPKIHQHHHLVCMDCEKIIDIEDAYLNRLARPNVRGLGFDILDYIIHFRGICEQCRQGRDEAKKTPRRARPHRAKKSAPPAPNRSTQKRRTQP